VRAAVAAALLLVALGTMGVSVVLALPVLRPSQIRVVAVLPLANRMGGASQAYFVDGMHDALITELAEMEGLTVISRTSVLRYRDSERPIREIAAELGVDGVVEGSVFASDDSVAVSVQLIRGDSEKAVWAQRYEGRIDEALGLQRRVARSIAEEIRLAVQPVDQRSATIERIDARAQEAYLQGRAHWRTRSRDGLARAIGYLERAVALAPDFAPAHAALADAYTVGRGYGAVDLPWAEAYRRAEAAARRALELDPDLPDAHVALGFVELQAERDLIDAELRFRRAVHLNPSHAQAHAWLALTLRAQGRLEEAVLAASAARRLDPFAPVMSLNLGFALLADGRCDEALAQADAALDLDPTLADGHSLAWRCHALDGRHELAVDEAEEAFRDWGLGEDVVQEHHEAWEAGGWTAALEQEVRVFRSDAMPVRSAYLLAQRLALLGEVEEALDALGSAYDEGDPLLVFELASDPVLAPLRSEPRFRKIAERVAEGDD
jgi:TolB-like protein